MLADSVTRDLADHRWPPAYVLCIAVPRCTFERRVRFRSRPREQKSRSRLLGRQKVSVCRTHLSRVFREARQVWNPRDSRSSQEFDVVGAHSESVEGRVHPRGGHVSESTSLSHLGAYMYPRVFVKNELKLDHSMFFQLVTCLLRVSKSRLLVDWTSDFRAPKVVAARSMRGCHRLREARSNPLSAECWSRGQEWTTKSLLTVKWRCVLRDGDDRCSCSRAIR